ncbi:MAG: hypothetical protein VZR64_12540, partial [Eubacterium sp.]|nr:hypothetical protein [Eubacterium sp.]
MSFRLKITILTTLLVAMLFSLGSTIMIHRSYMDSLTREEQEAVDNVQMVTSIIQISYESGQETGDEQLVQTLRRLATYQTSSDVFLLYKGKNLIYGNSQLANIDVNMDRLSKEMKGKGDIYVSYDNEFSGMEFIIGASEIVIDDDTYIICVCRDVSYVSNMRKRLHQMFV